MRRTIRRISRRLNKGKWEAVEEIAARYADEKNSHLQLFNSARCFCECRSERTRRDALVKEKYKSPYGLQGRMWKLALKDAYEIAAKHHGATAKELRGKIGAKKEWSESQKRYANWLICTPKRQARLVSGLAPVPTHFKTEYDERGTVRNTLRRSIRLGKRKAPRVKMARSVNFDGDMYEIFEHKGVQYIKIMSLKRGKRIVIPLKGNTAVKGNIRIVLDRENRRVEIHYTAEVKKKKRLEGEKCGLDAGITEVFTDEYNNRYGRIFGATLSKASEYMKSKGQKRNKLHQIKKKTSNRKKARNIDRFNLKKKKRNKRYGNIRAEMEKQIDTAVNEVLEHRKPSLIVTEKLDIRGKAKSKRMSRLVSLWIRRALNDRVEFKASAGGSRREQVNPAYSSQTCPLCLYLSKANRKGDAFQCLKCGHADDADRVGAHNLKARHGDPQILLWTPKERVKAILLGRFIAGWKPPQGGDCSGQDSRTASEKSRTESETAGGNYTKSSALNIFEYN